MQTIAKLKLWRVSIANRNGYEAPSQLVEAKTKDIHKIVQGLHLRLLDFPEKWSYKLTDLNKEFDPYRGKWVPEGSIKKRLKKEEGLS